MSAGRYRLDLTRRAERDLVEKLPESAAAAVIELINGPLLDNPRRMGAPLGGRLAGLWCARRGEYRVLYQIHEERHEVEIVRVAHRRDAYRFH